MKATTMTLTAKRQAVLPLGWCQRAGLERGGKVSAIDTGHGTLIISAVKPPSRADVKKLLSQPAAGSHTPRDRKSVV